MFCALPSSVRVSLGPTAAHGHGGSKIISIVMDKIASLGLLFLVCCSSVVLGTLGIMMALGGGGGDPRQVLVVSIVDPIPLRGRFEQVFGWSLERLV